MDSQNVSGFFQQGRSRERLLERTFNGNVLPVSLEMLQVFTNSSQADLVTSLLRASAGNSLKSPSEIVAM